MIARELQTAKLRIVHVFRAPLGGLFRHVVDLAAEQAKRGHDVGMFFDSGGDGPRVREALDRIPGALALGVETAPIRRNPGPSDVRAFARFSRWLKVARPDIVHGHGSKGGVFARLARWSGAPGDPIRAYTPHGGSFNYRPGSAIHRVYMAAEALAARSTDVFLFESAYIAGRYDKFVGVETGTRRVVANGLSEAEFELARADPGAADLLYVGELRAAKGIDTLLDAMPRMAQGLGRLPRAALVGSGPDKAMLSERAAKLGIADRVSFPGPMPIRQAFKLGKILVVPSRAESMPYVVLEAAAARVPMVASDVGGIPEIFGPFADWLGPSDDADDLARRLVACLRHSDAKREQMTADLAQFVQSNFSIRNMVDAVMSGYREALDRRRPREATAFAVHSRT